MTNDELVMTTDEIIARSIERNTAIKALDLEDNTRKLMSMVVDDVTEYINICSIIGFSSICTNNPNRAAITKVCEEKLSSHANHLLNDKDLFYKLKDMFEYKSSKISSCYDEDELYLLDAILLKYMRCGIDCDESEYDNLAFIRRTISRLEMEILAAMCSRDKRVAIENEHSEKMPNEISQSMPRDNKGNIIVDLGSMAYNYCLMYVGDTITRKNIELARGSLCKDNVAKYLELFCLKNKMAYLMGYDNYASYVLEVCMLCDPDTIKSLLNNVASKTLPRYIREVKELMKIKKRETPDDRKIELWDIDYLVQKWRHNYGINDAEVRTYFPLEHVLPEMLSIYSDLFSITIKLSKEPVWDDAVMAYDVIKNDDVIGIFYLDLFQRDNKQNTTRCVTIQPGCQYPYSGSKDITQLPRTVLVANMVRDVNVLNFQDVVFLFNEMAHVMHNIFGAQPISHFSGVVVEKDYVKIPSLVMEKLCWEPDIMKRLSSHYISGRPIPDTLINKLRQARNIDIGIHYRKNIFFALYDLMVHSSDKFFSLAEKLIMDNTQPDIINDTMYDIYRQSFNKIFKVEGLEKMDIEMIHNAYPPAFTPVMILGNECFNYNCIWGEICATDIYVERFNPKDLLNKENGQRFIDELFSYGGSRKSMDGIVSYLGRKPTIDNFLSYNDMIEDDEMSIFFHTDRTETNLKKIDIDSETIKNDSDEDNRFTEGARRLSDESAYMTENTETLRKYKNIFIPRSSQKADG